ncbi:MAG: rhodanese-like domain-containing protein [Gemmatimonadota bacterium]
MVLHCQGGGRAAIAASLLKAGGLDAANVRGGYDEWSKSGRPVERGTSAEAIA